MPKDDVAALNGREVTYEGHGYNVTIHVKPVTIVDDTVRDVLINRARIQQAEKLKQELETGKTASLKDLASRIIEAWVYPSCIACLGKVTNHKEGTRKVAKEPSFDQFAKLPGQLVRMWEQAAIEVNPHWALELAKGDEETEEGKGSKPADSRK